MTTQHQAAQGQKVHLSLKLDTSPPHTISIHDPEPSQPLKLIATIEQTESPFPDRPVTILTAYSCLDTTPSGDAFFSRAMHSPEIARTTSDVTTSGGAPELFLRPVGKWITTTRISGDPDLMKRDPDDGFRFLTIPPVGQGHAEVTFTLPPSRLMQRLGDKKQPLSDKLEQFLRPGDVYKITPGDRDIRWWAFGSLEDWRAKGTQIARWTFPDDLSLRRGEGEDETDDVAHRLRDLVDLHDVNHLSSRSAVDGEERPDVGRMRRQGWIFGEPEVGLVMDVDEEKKEALFSIVE